MVVDSLLIMERKKSDSMRNSMHYKSRNKKLQTNKILDRITFNPEVHKQKVTRNLRQKLQKKKLPHQNPTLPPSTLKFGSFNINGLDLEACWAVEELLKKHGFDVMYKLKYFKK